MTIESAGLPLRTFRVGIKSGKHGKFLGTVEAVDQEAAATPTASAAAKPRKATSQTFQSPIESVIGAPAQSSPGGARMNGPAWAAGAPTELHANTWPGLPMRAPGVMPVPCEQRETRRRRSEPDTTASLEVRVDA
jgi:hypothetical protein